jgi:hypothetical protein
MLVDDSDHTALFEKKASVKQIGLEELRGKAKAVSMMVCCFCGYEWWPNKATR